MSSMDDLGRKMNEMRDQPKSAHPRTELDELEGRLHEFFAWARGRPHPEIRERFASDFSAEPLHDEVVSEIGEGRGPGVRHRLPMPPSGPDATPY